MPDQKLRWMLLIDTCGTTGGIAVADLSHGDGTIVAERELPGRETQERLMSAMAEVLAEASLTVSHVSALAVVTGPGSFTGTRIGLAAAKGVAEACSLPVVAISRLAMLAAQAAPASAEIEVQAWIDAGRGDVFIGRYRDGRRVSERMEHGVVAADGIAAGDVVVAMEERVAALAPQVLLLPQVTILAALPLAVAKIRGADFADIALLDANYLRVPDAELARLAAESAKLP